jgi:hypothetical protein
MMTLLLRNFSHAVHESQRLGKIREIESPLQVVALDHAPAWHLALQRLELRSRQGWHAAFTRHTSLACKIAHFQSTSVNQLAAIILQPKRLVRLEVFQDGALCGTKRMGLGPP